MTRIMAFMTVLDFKNATGIALDDHNIETALVATAQKIKHLVFYKKSYTFTQPDDKFKLEGHIADYDCDGEITVDDFNIYEFDKDDYVTPETDRKSNVVTFVPKYGMITMDDSYPKDNKKLIIDFMIARFDNEVMKPYLRRLNTLMACDSLFTNIPIKYLQDGISSWNLNGVSVTFDSNSLVEIKESLKQEMNTIIKFIRPVIYEKTKLGFDRDDVRKWGYSIESPGGRRYISR